MRVGAVFPQTEIGADRGGVRAYVEGVAELGFAHLLAYDHVLGAEPSGHPGFRGPYTHESMFHEIMVLFGFVAAVAPELELITGVVIAPQRQTVLLAKQAAELDVLSGGRLRLGLGLGWNAVEYEGLGMRFTNRGRRFEEQIDLLRRLWQEPVLTYEGRWERVTSAGLNPLPIQRPIPIWIGANLEPALRRAARLGEGYIALRPLEGGWDSTLERLRGWLEEAGRDPADFGLEARINVSRGSPDEWRAEAGEWRARGATHVSLLTMGGALTGPEAHVERLRVALEAVG